MTKKEKKARLAGVVEALKRVYPQPVCALESGGDPWRLLVMGSSSLSRNSRIGTLLRFLMARGILKRSRPL